MRRGSSRLLRLLLVTLLALIGGFVWLIRFAYQAPIEGEKLRLDELLRATQAREVLSATFLDQDAEIIGTRCLGAVSAPAPGGDSRPRCDGQERKFFVSYPQSNVATQSLIDVLAQSGATVVVDKQSSKAIAKLLATFIFPLAMLANLFGIIFVSKAGDSSIADVAGFGTIRKKRQRRLRVATEVTFADVAGADEAITELKEVTDYLTDPDRFEAYGAAPPKGVLLFGPPGCGKTLLARAAAGETGVPFFSISGAEFVESLVGVGAARVRDLFRQVRDVAPAIVFIDEIDAVGRARAGEGMTGGEREQTVNQLLVEMDGFEVSAGIVVMAATNRPDILDPALMRPGRFDRHITLQPPNYEGRRAILELHSAGKPLAADVDFNFLAQRTPGFTGADLANVVNEAALIALREGEGTSIRSSHLSEAVVRVLHGPQRRGRLMNPEERRRVAYHEAGHAIVGAVLTGDAPDRVSIVARGRGLGSSSLSEEADRTLLTQPQLETSVVVALAGLAAETTAFGVPSTAADDDLERASAVARQMVGRYGMAPSGRRLRVLAGREGFLGPEGAMTEIVSDRRLYEFDLEVERVLHVAEQKAGQILAWNRHLLAELAEVLEDRETLEGDELDNFLRGAQVEMDALALIGAAPSNGSQDNEAEQARARRTAPQ